MEPFSTPCTEPHQLLTPLGALPAQALQPSLSLSFLQAQLLKQFLQKPAFRKDKQGFYLSYTAVTLHHVGKPERWLWLLRVSWGGKCGHAKHTKVRMLAGERPCRETRSSIRFGAAPHIFLKLGEFGHKMELWPCAFQRQVVGTGNADSSCKVVCLCHHTLHPCKEKRGARQHPGNNPLLSGLHSESS